MRSHLVWATTLPSSNGQVGSVGVACVKKPVRDTLVNCFQVLRSFAVSTAQKSALLCPTVHAVPP